MDNNNEFTLPLPIVYDYASFARYVTRNARHIFDPSCRKLLKIAARTAKERVTELPSNVRYWRSQLGCDMRENFVGGPRGIQIEMDKQPAPYKRDRMMPFVDKAKEGRVNAKGIPCFYCATTPDTSMGEVRPWIGAHVTVAEVRFARPLRVVDCTLEPYGGNGLHYEFVRNEPEFWTDLNRAFSIPVSPTDDTADYAPTQVIAELLRSRFYDGLMYQSRLGSGKNVAIFDLSLVEIGPRSLHRIEQVDFKSAPASNFED